MHAVSEEVDAMRVHKNGHKMICRVNGAVMPICLVPLVRRLDVTTALCVVI